MSTIVVNEPETLRATPETSVSDVLTLLGHELRMMSDGVSELQDVIGNILSNVEPCSGSHLYELQSIDKLCQTLAALSEFIDGIAEQASPDWRVDASRAALGVKLADLSNRLNGRAAQSDESDVFDCFDDWAMTG